MPRVASKTADKQRKMPKGKPFEKGDPRINRKGRPPKNSDELNALIDEILAEESEDSKGHKMQNMRILLKRLLFSKSPVGQIHILDRRFGKIPQPVAVEGNEEKPIKVIVEYADTNGNPT